MGLGTEIFSTFWNGELLPLSNLSFLQKHIEKTRT